MPTTVTRVGFLLLCTLSVGCAEPTVPVPADTTPTVEVPTAVTRPNIILILTDDQDTSLKAMPQVRGRLAFHGTTLARSYATTSVCCPARASLMTGQYTHNHDVRTMREATMGGYPRFIQLGLDTASLGIWMQRAGYRTSYIGKFLNDYPGSLPSTHIPQGWHDWHGLLETRQGRYLNYDLNENGTVRSFDGADSSYSTDVFARRATTFIRESAGQPFFLVVAPFAPHGPTVPARRHAGRFAGHRVPRVPSFNEADISDKPLDRQPPLLSAAEVAALDAEYQKRQESLIAVDEMVVALLDTLQAVGQLSRTIIIYTSDHGYHMGQHRLPSGKVTPYEEDVRVPLIMRGPGIAKGFTTMYAALNLDLAPTILEFAGVSPPASIDGRSLMRVLRGQVERDWRTGFLGEMYQLENGTTWGWRMVRTDRWAYIERIGGAVELYDMPSDPYQLQNVAGRADLATLQQGLHGRLVRLAACAGASCRAEEDR